MTLQQLEYLLALDDCRHFVQAAEKCFVTQPTLSMQIQKLEDELGIKLFNRNHKPIKPTRAGSRVIARARRIIGEVRDLERFLDEEKESLEGEFRLGIIPTLAPYILPLFLPAFIRDYPQTRLKVLEMQTADIVVALKAETLDLGLLVSPLEDGNIREMHLFHEPFLLYLPDNHPLVESQLIQATRLDPRQMLILTEGHCFRNQVLNICKDDSPTTTSGFFYESGSIETLKKMVDKGLGYTLVPQLSVDPLIHDPKIKTFAPPVPVREIALATSFAFNRPKLLNTLAQCILSNLPEQQQTTTPNQRIPIY